MPGSSYTGSTLLAFLLNFIPSIGSIVATLLPLPVVLFNPEIGTTTAVLAIAVPGVIQLVLGNVVDPLVMGESLDLYPVAIVLSLILWGMIWGAVGMLLAAPIAAILKLLLERLELGPMVERINAAEKDVEGLSDDELKARTDWLKKRVTDGEALDALCLLAETEGIIPALESAHAVAEAVAVGLGLGLG